MLQKEELAATLNASYTQEMLTQYLDGIPDQVSSSKFMDTADRTRAGTIKNSRSVRVAQAQVFGFALTHLFASLLPQSIKNFDAGCKRCPNSQHRMTNFLHG